MYVFLFFFLTQRNSVCFNLFFLKLIYPTDLPILACRYLSHSFFFFIAMWCVLCVQPLSCVCTFVHIYLHIVKVNLHSKFLEVRSLRRRVNSQQFYQLLLDSLPQRYAMFWLPVAAQQTTSNLVYKTIPDSRSEIRVGISVVVCVYSFHCEASDGRRCLQQLGARIIQQPGPG